MPCLTNDIDQLKNELDGEDHKDNEYGYIQFAFHARRNVQYPGPIHKRVYDKENAEKESADDHHSNICRADVGPGEFVVSYSQRFRKFVLQAISKAYVEQGEPGEHGAEGQPDAILHRIDISDRQRNTQQGNQNGRAF